MIQENNNAPANLKTYSSNSSLETSGGIELKPAKPLMNLARLAAGIDEESGRPPVLPNQLNLNKKKTNNVKPNRKSKNDIEKATVEQVKEQQRNKNSSMHSKIFKCANKIKTKSKSKDRIQAIDEMNAKYNEAVASPLYQEVKYTKGNQIKEIKENKNRRIDSLAERIMELQKELNNVKQDLVTEDDNQRFNWLQTQLTSFDQLLNELKDNCQRNKILSDKHKPNHCGQMNGNNQYNNSHDNEVYQTPAGTPENTYYPEQSVLNQQFTSYKQPTVSPNQQYSNKRSDKQQHILQPSDNFYSLKDTLKDKDGHECKKAEIAGPPCQKFEWDETPIPDLDGKDDPYKLEPSSYANSEFVPTSAIAGTRYNQDGNSLHNKRDGNYVSPEKLLSAAENVMRATTTDLNRNTNYNGKTNVDLPETSNKDNRFKSKERNRSGDAEISYNAHSDWYCDKLLDNNVNILKENLTEAVYNITKNHKVAHVALTLLIRPDNIYHISISLLRTGEVLGCLYANEKCIIEASKQGLFENYLSFFVVDSHNSIEQKRKLLQYSFNSNSH